MSLPVRLNCKFQVSFECRREKSAAPFSDVMIRQWSGTEAPVLSILASLDCLDDSQLPIKNPSLCQRGNPLYSKVPMRYER